MMSLVINIKGPHKGSHYKTVIACETRQGSTESHLHFTKFMLPDKISRYRGQDYFFAQSLYLKY